MGPPVILGRMTYRVSDDHRPPADRIFAPELQRFEFPVDEPFGRLIPLPRLQHLAHRVWNENPMVSQKFSRSAGKHAAKRHPRPKTEFPIPALSSFSIPLCWKLGKCLTAVVRSRTNALTAPRVRLQTLAMEERGINAKINVRVQEI